MSLKESITSSYPAQFTLETGKGIKEGAWDGSVKVFSGVFEAGKELAEIVPKMARHGLEGPARQALEAVKEFGMGTLELLKGVRMGVWHTLLRGNAKDIFSFSTLNPLRWPGKIWRLGKSSFWYAPKELLTGIGQWLKRSGWNTAKHGLLGVPTAALQGFLFDPASGVLKASGKLLGGTEQGLAGMLTKVGEGVDTIGGGLVPKISGTSGEVAAVVEKAKAKLTEAAASAKEAITSKVQEAGHKVQAVAHKEDHGHGAAPAAKAEHGHAEAPEPAKEEHGSAEKTEEKKAEAHGGGHH